MHDPRRTKRLSARDIEALTFIGEGFEVAQYQLHAAIFPAVSAVMVSHFVKRGVANGLIAVERWNRVGINRLRLTATGRRTLIAHGADPASLFAPRRPVAAKDVAHTLWINDLRVIFRRSDVPFDRVLPAWQLQRRLSPPPAAIPDVLAIRQNDTHAAGFVCACEVDLGGERLAKIFLPKLIKLNNLVRDWSGDSHSAVIVLTRGPQRAASIRELLASVTGNRLEAVVHELPSVGGVDGLAALTEALADVLPFRRPLNTS
ncbi:MAG: hypothetical protein ACRD3J_07165 [Thermoanaerobaculia bacterium]